MARTSLIKATASELYMEQAIIEQDVGKLLRCGRAEPELAEAFDVPQ
jgi:hypothetical protein